MRIGHVLLALSLCQLAACSTHEKSRDDDDPPSRVTRKTSDAKPRPSAAGTVETSIPVPSNAGVTISVEKVDYAVHETVDVKFSRPLAPPPGQQYWITITKPDDPESTFGNWHYVPAQATSDQLIPAGPGDWEVRLHDLYPQWKEGHIIARQRILVKAGQPPETPPVAKEQPRPAECTPGNPGACACGDGRTGLRGCSASGHWLSCDCSSSAQMPKGGCEYMKTSPCTCPGGGQGVTICNGHGWEPCAC